MKISHGTRDSVWYGRAVVPLIVWTLVLGACSSDDGTETTSADGASTTAAGESSTTTAGESTEPRVLTMAAERPLIEPIGLLERTGGMKIYTDLIGDTLIHRDYETGELTPMLATDWEQVEPNRWRFSLRDDVTFHNGEPFNAEAVAWSVTTQTVDTSPARVVRYSANMPENRGRIHGGSCLP